MGVSLVNKYNKNKRGFSWCIWLFDESFLKTIYVYYFILTRGTDMCLYVNKYFTDY